MAKRFSIKERVASFNYALEGMRTFFEEEHNAYIHLLASVGAVGMGFYFGISNMEWIIIVLCIGLVFSAEIFNTSIEALANHVSPDWHKEIKKVKDLAAAGVLIVAIAAGIIGLVIFLPYILGLFVY